MYNKYLTEPEVWDSTKQYKHIAVPEALPVGLNLVAVPQVNYQGVTYYAFSKAPTKGVTPNTPSSGWKPIAVGGGGTGNIDSINGSAAPNQILKSDDDSVTINTDINTGVTDFSIGNSLNNKYDKTGGTISGDVHVSRVQKAGTVALVVENTDNTDSVSGAQTKITTAGANAGNPYATFTTYGVADWSQGFNNQTKKYEIARANILGTNTTLTIDSNSNIDIPSGTLSVSRDPVSAKEVATKAYIDSRSYDEGVNLLEIDADVTLTEISALLPVSPSVDRLKVLLPTMNYIRQKLSVGQTFQVLNVDFNSNSFDICYADGTVIKTLKALEMFEIMIQKNTTQGQDLYPYPKTLFILSETRGELGGLIILQPDDFYDDPNGNTHLVPSGGQAGQILQSNGPGTLPTFVDSNIPSSVITPFTPTDESGANLTFTGIKAHYTTFGKMVFVTMIFVFPSTTSTLTAKIGGFPVAFNSSTSPQVGSCLVTSSTIAGDFIFAGIPGQTAGNVAVQGVSTPNKTLADALVIVTLSYMTN